ncbi:nitrate reductase cytochrome c-type subunit [Piscinibacter gummiphilus]|uniref:Periplasmic nitrate reductase, electron transfer subunit n=2 Tax=Piscinibacter gummiphilus TaxID=946333 RepID=A0ABZ0CTU6_9BURK|nr:nitrate reductase cytochrome c-type subunit [Piscinibacter gummiphilus]WOB08395.1 nitrate reductase cytochrome c-type subunit [Piscinibacter gummiphilus]
MRRLLSLLLATVLSLPAVPMAQTAASAPASAPLGLTDAARGPTPIDGTTKPPRLTNSVNDDRRLPRNYDMQPPVVPHRVDGYQIDKNFNKCMDCHARDKAEFSGAVPVSKTHYIDRNGRVLDRISTRRYFCQQCHVSQEPVAPITGNRFQGLTPQRTTP